MKTLSKALFAFGAALAALTLWGGTVRAADVNAYFFYGDGCPHCVREHDFLERELKAEFPGLSVYGFEIYNSPGNVAILRSVSETLKVKVDGVPFLVIGDRAFIGYANGTTSSAIRGRAEECAVQGCPDSVAAIVGLPDLSAPPVPSDAAVPVSEAAPGEPETPVDPEFVPDSGGVSASDETVLSGEGDGPKPIRLPVFGEIDAAALSLPALAVLMGVLDGFNPCATWILLFLISLLLGMKDRKRMWLLGSVFIMASAGVYFLFMTAWLNLMMFIGMVAGVRLLIGLLALLGGGYSLKEFLTNRESGCKAAGDERRQKVFARLREIVRQNSLWVALGGIILLAFAVNLVELLCSAGLPAVFTQVLAMNDLSAWRQYLYIGIYILFFMIDDLFLFFAAMVTLEMVGVTTRYARFSRLVGGLLMLAIGLLLIFRPGWLMFG